VISLCTDVLLFQTCGTCGGAGERPVYTDRDWCGDCSGGGEVAIDMSPVVTFFFNVSIAAGLFVAAGSTRCESEVDGRGELNFCSMEDLDDVCF
jgi:hypothetical protein